jgi:hypothetical protein
MSTRLIQPLQPLQVLWRGPGQAAWHDGDRPRRGLHMLVWSAAFLAGAGLCGAVWGPRLGALMAQLLLLVMSSVAWTKCLGSLMQQNQPALARLVPGHVSRLRAALWLLWSALACVGLLLSWYSWGTPLRTGPLWALWLLVLAWGMRHPLLWTVVWIPSVLWPWMPSGGLLTWAWQVSADAGHRHPLFSMAVVLLLGAALLAPLLQSGNAGHVRWYARWSARRAAQRASLGLDPGSAGAEALYVQPGPQVPAGLASRLKVQLGRPARWAMAQARRRALAPPTRVLPRLQLALGPAAQFQVQAVGMLGFASIFVVLAVLFRITIALDWLPSAERLSGIGNASFAALGFSLAVLQQIRAAVARTAAERALVSLAPGHRGQPDLPRRLAGRLLLQYQGLCAFAFLVVALVLPGTSVYAPALLFWTVAALSGLGLCWSLHDAATSTRRAGLALQQGFVLPMLLAGLLALALALGAVSLSTWLAVAAGMAMVAGARGWWLLARQPGLFDPAALHRCARPGRA